MQSGAHIDESAVATTTHFFSSHTGVRRHRVTFQLADGEARELSAVGRLKADGTSCSTRSAVWDIFAVLAYSDWCWVCAGRAARYLASKQGPSEPGNALVFADTRERSKTGARSKLVASSATHDASLANSQARRTFRSGRWGCQNTATRLS